MALISIFCKVAVAKLGRLVFSDVNGLPDNILLAGHFCLPFICGMIFYCCLPFSLLQILKLFSWSIPTCFISSCDQLTGNGACARSRLVGNRNAQPLVTKYWIILVISIGDTLQA